MHRRDKQRLDELMSKCTRNVLSTARGSEFPSCDLLLYGFYKTNTDEHPGKILHLTNLGRFVFSQIRTIYDCAKIVQIFDMSITRDVHQTT